MSAPLATVTGTSNNPLLLLLLLLHFQLSLTEATRMPPVHLGNLHCTSHLIIDSLRSSLPVISELLSPLGLIATLALSSLPVVSSPTTCPSGGCHLTGWRAFWRQIKKYSRVRPSHFRRELGRQGGFCMRASPQALRTSRSRIKTQEVS